MTPSESLRTHTITAATPVAARPSAVMLTTIRKVHGCRVTSKASKMPWTRRSKTQIMPQRARRKSLSTRDSKCDRDILVFHLAQFLTSGISNQGHWETLANIWDDVAVKYAHLAAKNHNGVLQFWGQAHGSPKSIRLWSSWSAVYLRSHDSWGQDFYFLRCRSMRDSRIIWWRWWGICETPPPMGRAGQFNLVFICKLCD